MEMVVDQSPQRLTRGQQEILIKIFEKDVFINSNFSMPNFPVNVCTKSVVKNKTKNLSRDLVYTLKHFTFDRDLLNYLLEMKDFVGFSQPQLDAYRLG